MKSTVNILVFLFFLNSLLSAQCLLKGKITDTKTNQIIEYATLEFSQNNKSKLITHSDSLGNYSFNDFKYGKYTVKVSREDYYPATQRINLTKKSATINFSLQLKNAQRKVYSKKPYLTTIQILPPIVNPNALIADEFTPDTTENMAENSTRFNAPQIRLDALLADDFINDTTVDSFRNSSIKGVITERRSKKALSNVEVKITDSTGAFAIETTNEKGEYCFRRLPSNNYTITISAKNFRDTIFKRTVVKGENIFDFVLSQYRRAQPPRGR